MNKLWSIFQYGYLVIGVIFLVEGILNWNSNREQSFIMFGFAIFITLIFFFKRNFRRKIEERNKQN
ncbi:hypothetical protein C7447_10351 [Tenacibaculum adriaticum]|uniref:LPXTG-motif cell wall-anchored protein n=1 Tax=Tenacibaculum adriaticum TaxID=413713 RepID=A0A5S5DQ83_9FLAO|nr:hypothetical protein [Tenacibaculum adriaticum]TYP97885.1 hypothetical protein C7447_10351 [Tenacibaculum adriaticum]